MSRSASMSEATTAMTRDGIAAAQRRVYAALSHRRATLAATLP